MANNLSAIKLPNGITYNLKDNISGYITASSIPVNSVNGKTGDVVLDADDVGALPANTTISKVHLVRW